MNKILSTLSGHWLRLVVMVLLVLPGGTLIAADAESDALVNRWLQSQTNLQTWSADLVQTRTLKSLTEPLQEEGRVWFSAPDRFRWELGSPPKTIAVRQPEQMLVLYPRFKRAERYPLTAETSSGWRDTLALLEAGFPRSRAELEDRYRIQSATKTNDVVSLKLEPRSSRARRMMPQITIGFGTNNFELRFTELKFADGSTMRNDFTNTVTNPEIAAERFEPELGADFKVVEPLEENSNR